MELRNASFSATFGSKRDKKRYKVTPPPHNEYKSSVLPMQALEMLCAEALRRNFRPPRLFVTCAGYTRNAVVSCFMDLARNALLQALRAHVVRFADLYVFAGVFCELSQSPLFLEILPFSFTLLLGARSTAVG